MFFVFCSVDERHVTTCTLYTADPSLSLAANNVFGIPRGRGTYQVPGKTVRNFSRERVKKINSSRGQMRGGKPP